MTVIGAVLVVAGAVVAFWQGVAKGSGPKALLGLAIAAVGGLLMAIGS
jgi:uncharacterized membrane protein